MRHPGKKLALGPSCKALALSILIKKNLWFAYCLMPILKELSSHSSSHLAGPIGLLEIRGNIRNYIIPHNCCESTTVQSQNSHYLKLHREALCIQHSSISTFDVDAYLYVNIPCHLGYILTNKIAFSFPWRLYSPGGYAVTLGLSTYLRCIPASMFMAKLI